MNATDVVVTILQTNANSRTVSVSSVEKLVTLPVVVNQNQLITLKTLPLVYEESKRYTIHLSLDEKDVLTLSQISNFRLLATERVCRRQF